MALKKFAQDPDEVLDYTIDWSPWLASGDTIVAATATGPAGITVAQTVFTITEVTIWVSGGTAGSSYDIEIHVTTNAGRQGDRTITIQIKDK